MGEAFGLLFGMQRVGAALILGVQFSGGQNEATADGVVGFLQKKVPGLVEGTQDQSVGVAGQGLVVVKGQICGGVEAQRRQALGRDFAGGGDLGLQRLGRIGIEGGGGEARKAQGHGAVGRVAFACESQ